MEDGIEETIQLMVKLEQQFTDPSFMCDIEELLNRNLQLFEDGEQRIECHEVYTEFVGKVEGKLEEFVKENQVSEEEVFRHCKRVYEDDPQALTCFEYIVAACEYDDFLDMMLTRRNLLIWREEEN
jgi:hypothetical protein